MSALIAAAALLVLVLGAERIPFAPVAVGLAAVVASVCLLTAGLPVSTADRYRRRARALALPHPEQSVRDLNRAVDLDPRNRGLLLERARVLRLLGQHERSSQDLRAYLNISKGEPRTSVLRARLLLQHAEPPISLPVDRGG